MMHRCPHPYHLTKRRRYIERGVWLIILVGLVLSFFAGRLSIGSVEEYQLENSRLQQVVKQLNDANAALYKKQDFVDSAKKIDEQADKELRLALLQLHDELSDVKEQLAFYQRVVAPETIIKGLHVSSFELKAINKAGEYRYELIIAQGVNKKRAIKGRYSFVIKGELDGVETLWTFEQMTKRKLSTKAFSFRYYEILTGEIKLPQRFKPLQIKALILPSSKSATSVEQQWAWQDVLKLG